MSLVAAAQGNPSLFIGPKVAAGLLGSILQGVLLSQMRKFCRYNENSFAIQSLVFFANAISLMQTCISLYNLWSLFVVNFGDWYQAVGISHWRQGIQSILIVLISVPAQGYLCWSGIKGNPLKMLALGILPFISFMTAIVVLIRSIIIECRGGPEEHPYPVTNDIFFGVFIISKSVFDVVVTVILVKQAFFPSASSSRRSVSSMTKGEVIVVWHQKIWESTLIPGLCALAMFSAFVADVIQQTNNRWLFFFQHILGKLYCISLMVSLNSRLNLDFPEEAKLSSIGPCTPLPISRPSIRIEVNRQIVRHVVGEVAATIYDKKSQSPPGGKLSSEEHYYPSQDPNHIEMKTLDHSVSSHSN